MKLSNAKLRQLAQQDLAGTRYFSDPAAEGLQIRVTRTRIRFYLRYRINGSQRNMAIGGFPALSLDDARLKVAELQRALLDGIDPLEERAVQRAVPTVNQFFYQHYLPHAKVHKRSWVLDESIYRNHLDPYFGKKDMNHVTAMQVQSFTQAKLRTNLSISVINRMLIVLGCLYTKAKKWQFVGVQDRSSLGIELLPNPNKVTRYLSQDEKRRLFEALDQARFPMTKHIVTFLLLTGARKRECLDARWTDFDLDAGVWAIPKTKAGGSRTVAMSTAAIELLETVSELHTAAFNGKRCPYVFCNMNTQKPYTQFYQAWQTARIRAGLEDFRLHDLRHTFASVLVSNGVSLYEVQELLGHSSPRMTTRYAHLSQDRLRNSAEVAAKVFELGSGAKNSKNSQETD